MDRPLYVAPGQGLILLFGQTEQIGSEAEHPWRVGAVMGLVNVEITREQVVGWGALDLVDEEQLDRWLAGRERLSLDAILDAETHGGRCMWVIMRPEVISERLAHQCGVDLARSHLALVDERGTYVDLRSRSAPAAKQEWLDGEVSLGGLRYAARRAEAASVLVSELDDPVAHITAQILAVVTNTEPYWTFRQMFYRHLDVFPDRDRDHAVRELVRERLHHVGTQ